MQVPGGVVKQVLLQNAATGTGNGTTVAPIDTANGAWTWLTCQVYGITTATITWEATVDGTHWVAFGMTATSDGSTVATTATADGIFRGVVVGYNNVRARISAHTTGTITVTGVLTS